MHNRIGNQEACASSSVAQGTTSGLSDRTSPETLHTDPGNSDAQ
jgi:hypothetical protein